VCTFPVLVLWGSDDGVVPCAASGGGPEILQFVPRAKVRIKRGAKHAFLLEDTEWAARELLAFF
jgi:pimeloyl-ACP methyl ester carboxylesterase